MGNGKKGIFMEGFKWGW